MVTRTSNEYLGKVPKEIEDGGLGGGDISSKVSALDAVKKDRLFRGGKVDPSLIRDDAERKYARFNGSERVDNELLPPKFRNLNPTELPETNIGGPSSVFSGGSSTFTIQDFSDFRDYVCEYDSGTIERNGDTISVYTNPQSTGIGKLTINDLEYAVSIIQPVLSAPTKAPAGSFFQVTITNYVEGNDYVVSVSDGSFVVNEDTVDVVTESSFAGFVTVQVNGTSVAIEVEPTVIQKPTIIAPLEGGLVSANTYTVICSEFAYTGVEDLTHLNTDWEFSLSSSFSNPIYTFYNDSVGKTTKVVNDHPKNSTMYVRARHRASNGAVSEWSETVMYSTHSDLTLVAITTPTEGLAQKDFGHDVAVDAAGQRMVIGAPATGILFENSGRVTVYDYGPYGWNEVAIFQENSVDLMSYMNDFGFAVRITADGKAILISNRNGYFNTPSGPSSASEGYGIVTLKEEIDGDWVETIFQNPYTDSILGNFGQAIAITNDKNTIAITAWRQPVDGNNVKGRLYLYERTNGVWSLVSNIAYPYPEEEGEGDRLFGYSVEFSPDGKYLGVSMVAKSTGLDSVILTYEKQSNGEWLPYAVFRNTLLPGLNWMCDFSMSNDFQKGALGTRGYSTSEAPSSGVVLVTDKIFNGNYQLETTLYPPNPKPNGRFGIRTRMTPDGNFVAVSEIGTATGVSPPNPDEHRGSVHLYKRIEGTLQLVQTINCPNDDSPGNFGIGLNISQDGKTVVIGSYNENGNLGAVYTYK
jgi:hypothetical protein